MFLFWVFVMNNWLCIVVASDPLGVGRRLALCSSWMTSVKGFFTCLYLGQRNNFTINNHENLSINLSRGISLFKSSLSSMRLLTKFIYQQMNWFGFGSPSLNPFCLTHTTINSCANSTFLFNLTAITLFHNLSSF